MPYKGIYQLFQNFPHFKQRKRTQLIFFGEGGELSLRKVNHAIETKQKRARENYKIEDREENPTY